MKGGNELIPDTPLHLDPIFLLGITHRSGTNFLRNLLLLHPDCGTGRVIPEDFLLANADLLVQYADSLYNRWQGWNVEEAMGPPEALCQHLGMGLISFLNLSVTKRGFGQLEPKKQNQIGETQPVPKRLVTKTPSVKNLRHFFKLFPNAWLLIVIRDGRSVVESGVKSFGWDYEQAMRKWAAAARKILQFDKQSHDAEHRYLIVKYEDIYLDIDVKMKKILSFLGLNSDTYDFEGAKNLPISGSSDLVEKEKTQIDWKFRRKTAEFNPLNRWKSWERSRHERFNWIAGDAMGQFGYTKETYDKNRLFWAMWNILMDLKWELRTQWQRLKSVLRRVLSKIH